MCRLPMRAIILPGMSTTKRLAALDWDGIEAELDEFGVGRLGVLLTRGECEALVSLYAEDTRFRSRIVMARHGFGRGEYKYFSYPLPRVIAGLRRQVYPYAARTANRWAALLGERPIYPDTHAALLKHCHAAGQTRPTPLLLKYCAGDYNCLHQDVYGDYVFPLQLAILLSDPACFEGGEFVVTEQRPRMQSRAEVISFAQGEALLFAVNERPRKGVRGYHRVRMRHGVSRVRSGDRMTAGIIFHDAR